MPGRRVLFDTSVLIPYFNGIAYTDLVRNYLLQGAARFSAVVIQELYTGTRTKQDKQDLDDLFRLVGRSGYIVTPREEDWVQAGQAISRYARLYGRINPRDHINDILILLSSRHITATVLTENIKHFKMWAGILSRSGIKVSVEALARSD